MLRRVWVGVATATVLAGVWAAGGARADDFDARRAKDVTAVVTSNGASGELKIGDDGKPTINAQAARIYFDVYFDDCDTAKALCDTMIFSSSWDTTKVSADQVNRWNRWTLFCPAYLDAKGEPDMWDAVALSQRTSKDDVANEVDRWMGCLQDFDSFAAAPDDFLKRNLPADIPAPPAAAPAPSRSAQPGSHSG